MRSDRALDATNFFLADVRDGLGPYLAIYLLATHQWDAASIGVVLSIGGLAGLLAQVPAGALVDALHAKRALLGGAALVVAVVCLAVPFAPGFWPVALSKAISGAAASVFAPGIAAISLGIAGRGAFTRRIGRNEAFNHAGNATAAMLAGALSLWHGPVTVFWLLAAMTLASLISILRIPAQAIDHNVARGLDSADAGASRARPGFRILLASPPLLVFAACAALFHLANAAMLPLVGQRLALQDPLRGTALMSACIVGAQLVMVPMAMLVGARAESWGRKPLLMLGFGALALRGSLSALSDDPWWLLAVQCLDGVGAGLFGALVPIVVADLTRGTGHTNAALGAVGTIKGVGASASNALAGFAVVHAGYDAAFLMLAGIAIAGLVLCWWAVSETVPAAMRAQPGHRMNGAAERI